MKVLLNDGSPADNATMDVTDLPAEGEGGSVTVLPKRAPRNFDRSVGEAVESPGDKV